MAAAAAADYTPRRAFFFPGQGAQSVGMAKELCEECPAAKELFDRASVILGYDLLDVCVNGPAERLNLTEVSQPAIYVASLAAVEKMKSTPEGAAAVAAVDVCAGLSLGEYTALTFAGAITFEDGVKLVKLRGESMQAAADATPSGMASVIGLSAEQVGEVCKAASEQTGGEPVSVANFLCTGNYAVSGSIPAINKVAEIAKPEFKARMVVKLAVAGAFHTEYMAPAAEALEAGLKDTPISVPRIPVISNVNAEPHVDADSIRKTLAGSRGSRVQGSGAWRPGSRVQDPGSRVQGPGFRVQGPGFRVQGPGFRVSYQAQGLKQRRGFQERVSGLGFRVQDLGLRYVQTLLITQCVSVSANSVFEISGWLFPRPSD